MSGRESPLCFGEEELHRTPLDGDERGETGFETMNRRLVKAQPVVPGHRRHMIPNTKDGNDLLLHSFIPPSMMRRSACRRTRTCQSQPLVLRLPCAMDRRFQEPAVTSPAGDVDGRSARESSYQRPQALEVSRQPGHIHQERTQPLVCSRV